MTEVFKTVNGIPNLQVSNMGRIRNLRTGNVFCGRINKKTRYRETCVNVNGKNKWLLVHRLVADAFCEKRPGATEVNHKNGDREDERADNLEWVTHGENLLHAYETGLMPNNTTPRAVIGTNMETGEALEFPSIYRAARELRISQGNICMCCKGMRPYANGYFWEYTQ